MFKENVGNVISKMIVINEAIKINLDNLSETLSSKGIKNLKILDLSDCEMQHSMSITDKGCSINYIEIDKRNLLH